MQDDCTSGSSHPFRSRIAAGLALALDKADKRNDAPEVMADDLLPLLEQAAGKGDCEAMLTLGVQKSLKDGDRTERAAWFLRAAQAAGRGQ
ncbi:hypothetical protein CFR75_10960 [Komagataeibacter xylinus]|uniref:Uncharacterized protein n=2 Tax=Komagataeibacter xylinus TaxID=28448 RepID=A0A318PLH6_KOMXY|nr:hypothetical protein [Komagataeibacter xylinus]AZV37922.1 hypothetical protein CXP35_02960 [Komagataeibacter xylinus]PYD56422.1 hypothetical protein CFR75_10960 [Komagataeibacter xylinus]GBQ75837.1 hypothetical protein AA15237_2156 [Komagataeibacter xylinus NBRC 15237]